MKSVSTRFLFVAYSSIWTSGPDLEDLRFTFHGRTTVIATGMRVDQVPEAIPAAERLIGAGPLKSVLIGGPGQGKSTLGQFIAQIHRAHILKRSEEFGSNTDDFTPRVLRIPIRIILKDYAQWITDTAGSHHVERFIATIIEERSGRSVSPEQIQELIKSNPILLILDGLDEVTDKELRVSLLNLVAEFINRLDNVLKADSQIIATSRPTGYSDNFNPDGVRSLHTRQYVNGKSPRIHGEVDLSKEYRATEGPGVKSNDQGLFGRSKLPVAYDNTTSGHHLYSNHIEWRHAAKAARRTVQRIPRSHL